MLQERYNRHWLLHPAHVCMVVEASSLKDGSGKELHRVHEVLAQVMDYKPGPFLTSLIQLKLDQTTVVEWYRHIQGTLKVPHHSELLKFLDLRARASESTTHEGQIDTIKHLVQSMSHMGNAQLKPAYFASAVNPALYAVGQSTLYMHAENSDCCHMTSALQQ